MELKVWDNYLFSFLSTSGSGAQEVPIGNNFSDNCSKKGHRCAGVDMRLFFVFHLHSGGRYRNKRRDAVFHWSIPEDNDHQLAWSMTPLTSYYCFTLNILVLLQEDHIHVYSYSVSSRYTTECRSEACVLEVLTVAKIAKKNIYIQIKIRNMLKTYEQANILHGRMRVHLDQQTT